jgi:circadian clock protein KaiB
LASNFDHGVEVHDASNDLKRFEEALEQRRLVTYVLQLYVCGMSPRSTDAIRNISSICEEFLPGRYALQVIDLYDDPVRAQADRLVAIPTLVRQLPLPVRRAVGDLSNRLRILTMLELA